MGPGVMASTLLGPAMVPDKTLQEGLTGTVGPDSSQDGPSSTSASTTLQVHSTAASHLSTDGASSEHSKLPWDPKEDEITPLRTFSTSNRPPLIHQTSAWDKKYVLTLDGGGVRGYSTLLIIQELMKICASLEMAGDPKCNSSYHPIPFQISQGSSIIQNDRRRSTRFLPVHYFDYIAGTSTGGLIAIMLSRLRMNIDDCIAEYAELGERIFGRRRLFMQRRLFSLRGPIPWNRAKYDEEELEKVVQEVVNKRLHISRDRAAGQMFPSHDSRCRTIVVAVKDNSASFAPYLFRTYDHSTATEKFVRNPGPPDHVRIADVARATTAAPTFFRPKVINDQKFLDGGFCTQANNPSQEAYNEILLMHGNNQEAVALLVSIGTGKLKNSTPFPKTNSMFGKYKATISYAVHAASDSERTHQSMEQRMASTHHPYERFNVDGGLDEIRLGDWKTSSQRGSANPVNVTLQTIENATRAYCAQREVRKRLERTAQMLVKNRQERSRTQHWDFAATGSRYHCTIDHCLQSSTMHTDREKLIEHLTTYHADLGYRNPPTTDAEKISLNARIQRGKVPHAD